MSCTRHHGRRSKRDLDDVAVRESERSSASRLPVSECQTLRVSHVTVQFGTSVLEQSRHRAEACSSSGDGGAWNALARARRIELAVF
jgi:hypothetical protein